MRRLRVLHVVSGLTTGGAETALCRLIEESHASIDHRVVVVGPTGPLYRRLSRLVPVDRLQLERRRPDIAIGVVRRMLSRGRVDIVHGWMYVGNLAALALRCCLPGSPAVIWGIRGSLHAIDHMTRNARISISLCRNLAGRPDLVVANSITARDHHRAIGIDRVPDRVIPNAIDTGRFRPDAVARRAVRGELSIPDGAPLIGHFGRFDRIKGQEVLLRAFATFEGSPSPHLVLLGQGMVSENPELAAMIPVGCRERVHLLGLHEDCERYYAALDVFVLPSHSESFPNALAEAMAAGVPCVASDVGDIATMMGDSGALVPPGDPGQLSTAIARLVAMEAGERRRLGLAARQRIAERYGSGSNIGRWIECYRSLLC